MAKGNDFCGKCYGIIYIIFIFNIFIAVESQSSSDWTKTTPAVQPVNHFDPTADAETLQKAMKGFGADTEAIVEVITKRDIAQRLKIAATYKTYYGEDLKDELNGELSGSVNKIVMALMTPLSQYYAEQLHNAVAGLGTDEEAIIGILGTLNNSEVAAVSKAYEQSYDTTLEKDLKEDTSGSFQRLIVSLVQANRDENQGVDEAKATVDAQALFNADMYDDRITQFNKILVNRSYQQLRAIFAEYKKISNHDIEKKIEKDIYGSVKMGFLTIAKCVKSKASFFAETLHTAMDGYLVDHSTLMRIIVTRKEIDLGDIKQAFLDKYEKTLASRITAHTSDYYQKALLSLVDN